MKSLGGLNSSVLYLGGLISSVLYLGGPISSVQHLGGLISPIQHLGGPISPISRRREGFDGFGDRVGRRGKSSAFGRAALRSGASEDVWIDIA